LLKIFLLVLFLTLPVIGVSAETENNLHFHEPILITSAGQSLDPFLVKAAFDQLGIMTELNTLAEKEDLTQFEQVVFVGGYSHKGISSANLSFNDEIQRINGLVNKAQENSIPVVFFYLGTFFLGDQREKELIQLIVPYSGYVILYSGCKGPIDYIYETAEENDIPVFLVESVNELSKEISGFISQ